MKKKRRGVSLLLKIICISLPVLCGCATVGTQTTENFEEKTKAKELIDMGTIFLRQGDVQRAQAAFEASWALDPKPASLDGLGCVAVINGDFSEAEELFKRAIKMDEHYYTAYSNLALLYELQGKVSEAKALYEKAVQNDPLNFKARHNYGALLYENGEEELGLREILRSQALSDHPLIVDNLRKLGFYNR